MSTSTTPSKIEAPWRKLFEEHISKAEQPTFTFTSLHSSNGVVTPRARTCIYRGMWANLPKNSKNTAEMNPELYDSDLITFTSDSRMAKVPEIFTGDSEKAPIQSSGGGAPVEAMFWLTETKQQWRIRGTAYVLGPDADSTSAARPTAAREAILPRMRKVKEGSDPEKWSWSREVTAHFGNVSPIMRGTFKNPPPGTPRSREGPPGTKMGQKVEDLQDKLARDNFRVVVVVPTEIDYANLSESADPRRYIYTFKGPDAKKSTAEGGELEGEWEKVETWP